MRHVKPLIECNDGPGLEIVMEVRDILRKRIADLSAAMEKERE